MPRLLRDTSWKGWLASALGAVAIAVACNLYIFVLRPFGAASGIDLAETGPLGTLITLIVPYVWLFLFAGMGTAFWLLVRGQERVPAPAWLIVVLVMLCAGYPIYTANLNSATLGLAGNFAVVTVAGMIVGRLWPITRLGAMLIVPVIVWVSLASVGLLALMSGQRF